jgi:PIN domain nuclease of toxin-antitoxin system
MKVLLDTHTFMWWDDDQAKLSPTALAVCQSPQNMLFVSVISVWEIQIKVALGKLSTRKPLKDVLQEQQQNNGLQILDVTLSHVLTLDLLPNHHKDPFDRLLIAQAKYENMALMSHDTLMSQYLVTILW